MRLFAFLALFILLLASVFVTSAKGLFEKVIITDVQSQEKVKISPEDSTILTQFLIFNWRNGDLKNIPENLGRGYEILRGSMIDGIFEPFDKLIYYPSENGRRGVIHYIGLIDASGQVDGGSEYDNRWYKMDSIAEMHLRHVLFNDKVDKAVPSNTSLWLESLFSMFQYQ